MNLLGFTPLMISNGLHRFYLLSTFKCPILDVIVDNQQLKLMKQFSPKRDKTKVPHKLHTFLVDRIYA